MRSKGDRNVRTVQVLQGSILAAEEGRKGVGAGDVHFYEYYIMLWKVWIIHIAVVGSRSHGDINAICSIGGKKRCGGEISAVILYIGISKVI